MHSEHSHSHPHLHHEQSKALKIALWIAFIFMFVEVAGGWISNSLALISDALHLFTDVGAILLSLIALRIAKRPRTPSMSYGYQRAEILGALASALSLWALSFVLIYESILRIINPPPVQGNIVFIIALIGLVANIMMVRVLHPTKGHSLNVKAAYLHVIGDLLGSIGVIISGVIIWIFGWVLVDPIITILFLLGILYSSGKIIKETVIILMEAAPLDSDPRAIQRDLQKIPGVTEVHDLHVWTVSPNDNSLSVHLVAKNTQQALNDAHRIIESKHRIHHMTIQVEDPASFERKYCYDCDKQHKKS
ncbi:MAG TPA: cation diffusion facilitator family transporter [Rhabdochlamydiaceae bacterium]|nr:cation diffusion facilitator family transporter [Rhabdochlamydiaceae bacterium]